MLRELRKICQFTSGPALRSSTGARRQLAATGLNYVEDLARSTTRIMSDIALPEAQHEPAATCQLGVLPRITGNVRLDLRCPIRGVVASTQLGQALYEIATMPEVAIAKDRHTFTGKDDVRAPSQHLYMDAIAKTTRPKRPAQRKLGFGVALLARTTRGGGGAQ